jgi:integrase
MHRAFVILIMSNDLNPAEMELLESRVTPGTIYAYRRARDHFYTFCRDHGYVLSLNKKIQFDRILLRYITHLYTTNQSRSRAQITYSAIMFFHFELRDGLHLSLDALKGWVRRQPGHSHTPLSWPMTVLIAATMAKSGYPGFALATLIAFDCFLRISEYVNLRVVDVDLSTQYSAGQRTFIRILHAKTGKNQGVELLNADINSLLQRWLSQRREQVSSSQSLFGITSTAQYSSAFSQTVTALGLSASHYVPHSLRHGGATHKLIQRMPMADIIKRGRWSSTKSASRYLQQAMAIRLDAVIPAHRQTQADLWCRPENFFLWMNDAMFPAS